jgi:hypothetical protein
MDGAVGCYRVALSLDPENRLFLSWLAEGFARGWFDPSDAAIPTELVACLAAGVIDPRRFVEPCSRRLISQQERPASSICCLWF